MSQEKATLDEVRGACDKLAGMRIAPSAASILKLVGGSKTTVVKHLRAVRAERLAGAQPLDMPVVFLQAVSEPLIRTIFERAREMVDGIQSARIETLETMQRGLMKDLEDSQANEEAALSRVEDLERQLKVRDDFETQLATLKRMVADAAPGGDPGAKKKRSNRNATMIVCQMIADAPNGTLHKDEIDRQMRLQRFSDTAAQHARFHVVDNGYALVSDDILSLTEKGERRLQERRNVR